MTIKGEKKKKKYGIIIYLFYLLKLMFLNKVIYSTIVFHLLSNYYVNFISTQLKKIEYSNLFQHYSILIFSKLDDKIITKL